MKELLCPVSHVWLFATPGTVACQAPLSMGSPRQEYPSELPFPTPGDLPNPGIEPVSLASPALAGGFFTTSATWKARIDTPITWVTPKGIMRNERSQTQTLHLYDFSQRQSCRNSRQISSFQKLRVGRGCDTRSAGGRSLFEFFRHVPCGILVPHQGLNLQLLSP